MDTGSQTLGLDLRKDLIGSRKRTRLIAWTMGLATEALYWTSVLSGGGAAILSASFAANRNLADNVWWVPLLASYATAGAVIIKQANLRARVALFFDYTSRCECLRIELDNPPKPHTLESVHAIAVKFVEARDGLQRTLYSIDTGEAAPYLGERSLREKAAQVAPTTK